LLDQKSINNLDAEQHQQQIASSNNIAGL